MSMDIATDQYLIDEFQIVIEALKHKTALENTLEATPEFLRMKQHPDVVREMDNYITMRDGNEYLTIGPRFTSIGESYDYAFGKSMDESAANYLIGFQQRSIEQLKRNFITFDKLRSVANMIYAFHDNTVDRLAGLLAIGEHWQDDDKTVYRISKNEWMHVRVQSTVINRTRRSGETKGTLSLTEARELGYTVEESATAKTKSKKAPDIPSKAINPEVAE